ncbi:Scr1 family TA system antitoxin-like transcriptional regulator [Amycolatopsis sp. H20-H5]|uniref:Scr1 family TA system antitoxin-like transcriptional regulator n=1 Tax=Amycolatopsis sp. H20-H5 TaxID=3046309 RepID=UPI002DB64951|nr:Scr1 family TA system antitoxin-like transcriptional regulator [Amycolatopsis sp. H20-H5]MEC3977775.1 Scr1 family TA system antitoxin-like transcriptional regulator [Amycolatopsis sp. H20-H5]
MTTTPGDTTPTDVPAWVADLREHCAPGLYARTAAHATAATLRQFQPDVIPAGLQTEDYAVAILAEYGGPDETNTVAAGIRAHHRAQVADNRIHGRYVLDGTVLRRLIGPPTVMTHQLTWLRELDSRPTTSIRVRRGVYPGMSRGLALFTSPGDAVEAFVSGEDSETPVSDRDITLYAAKFETLWTAAMPLEDILQLAEAAS